MQCHKGEDCKSLMRIYVYVTRSNCSTVTTTSCLNMMIKNDVLDRWELVRCPVDWDVKRISGRGADLRLWVFPSEDLIADDEACQCAARHPYVDGPQDIQRLSMRPKLTDFPHQSSKDMRKMQTLAGVAGGNVVRCASLEVIQWILANQVQHVNGLKHLQFYQSSLL